MQEYKQALTFGKTNKDETIINTLINRWTIAKRGNIGMIHIIVCEDSDMFI